MHDVISHRNIQGSETLYLFYSQSSSWQPYIRVGGFRPKDRCSSSRRRVAQEQIETRVTCDQLCRILDGLNKALHVCIQPFWVILPSPPPFTPRTPLLPHCSQLSSQRVTRSVALEPREKATGRKNREYRRKRRRWNESTGRVLLIFSNIWSARRRRRERGRRSPKKDSETKLEGREGRSLCVFFPPHPVRWPSVFSVLYLCCHGNSLDSREKSEKMRSRWTAQRGGEEKRTQRGNSGEEIVLRGRAPLFQISVPSAVYPQELTHREV